MRIRSLVFASAILALGHVVPNIVSACSRAVYIGPEDTIITVRSMDWVNPIYSNMWIFPRGIERNGNAGPGSIEWTSKYGSVITSAFDLATADGMNEKGLVTNLLYLTESEFPTPQTNDPRKPLALSLWAQYILDNYATVEEAVADLRKEPFYVKPSMSPDGKEGTVHISISDKTGDSAIFEYIGGKLMIHHSREYQVMTNSPVFDQQLALNRYWEEIGGTTMLPGTNRAADRFARASFYVNAVTQTSDLNEAVAIGFSVIRNLSVPMGISTPDQPNISSTRWRTVSDHRGMRYFFESVKTPNVFWVDFADVNFEVGAPIMKLDIESGAVYAGNVASEFVESEPMTFMAAD